MPVRHKRHKHRISVNIPVVIMASVCAVLYIIGAIAEYRTIAAFDDPTRIRGVVFNILALFALIPWFIQKNKWLYAFSPLLLFIRYSLSLPVAIRNFEADFKAIHFSMHYFLILPAALALLIGMLIPNKTVTVVGMCFAIAQVAVELFVYIVPKDFTWEVNSGIGLWVSIITLVLLCVSGLIIVATTRQPLSQRRRRRR